MKYPLRSDYETVVKYLDKFVLDSVLKKGKAVRNPHNPNFLLSFSGGKAIVYQIQTNSKMYALKCWVSDLGDLKIRFQAIHEYLNKVKLPYFVDFAYQKEGILVNGQKYPIIRMEWIDGIGFKNFISNNIKNPVYIRDLAEKFLEMVTILHQNNISHGDLQHGNILIRKNGNICLIDYDSLYVPQLSNEEDNIKGLPGYQHPNRQKLVKLSPKSDYFSELVIYLSLLVISEHPQYWQKIEQEERLLFSEKDLCNSRSAKIFGELAQLSDEIRYFTEQLKKCCQISDIEYLQPLEILVNGYKGTKITWDFPVNPKPDLSPLPPPVIVENDFGVLDKKRESSTTTVSNSDPWSKFDTNSSNIWDKFGETQTSTGDPFDKFDHTETPVKDPFEKVTKKDDKQTIQPPIDESIWDKFDNIWNKFTKSVSSIWDRIVKWFN
ncbi:protein kinase domain-containing protein [Geminocystis sp. GBBB08]|uniref:protein kinase domain-containing protein n=1 Tax=Geminocystis sp. GBBB08 TaxID=2604140 RepID=UPI0027E2EDD7|nr:AarF/UbiB family protein [Geminocystis sp. GBBB08]MBL1209140.1 protein kinase family protein [Geminocystis sp. GBBB08]